MRIGRKHGRVDLTNHNLGLTTNAQETIGQLWCIFDSDAKNIQHIGSTAIIGIKIKPMIDIAVTVDDFAKVEALVPAVKAKGFLHRKWELPSV